MKGVPSPSIVFSMFEPTRHSLPCKTVIANALESLDFLESLQSAFHHPVCWTHSPNVWAFASICTIKTKQKNIRAWNIPIDFWPCHFWGETSHLACHVTWMDLIYSSGASHIAVLLILQSEMEIGSRRKKNTSNDLLNHRAISWIYVLGSILPSFPCNMGWSSTQ